MGTPIWRPKMSARRKKDFATKVTSFHLEWFSYHFQFITISEKYFKSEKILIYVTFQITLSQAVSNFKMLYLQKRNTLLAQTFPQQLATLMYRIYCFARSIVLNLGFWWRHVKTIYTVYIRPNKTNMKKLTIYILRVWFCILNLSITKVIDIWFLLIIIYQYTAIVTKATCTCFGPIVLRVLSSFVRHQFDEPLYSYSWLPISNFSRNPL